MIPKKYFILICIILAAVSLTACELKASTPPPTSESDAQMATMQSALGNIATQTAAAGGAQVAAPTAILMATPTPTSTLLPAPPSPTPVPTEAPPPTAVPTTVPTTVPTSPVVTATPGIPATYMLQKGEHPYCIARRFNVNPTELLTLSGLSGGQTYQPGTMLTIPQTGNPFPDTRALKAHPTTYTVVSGDTIYSIACGFGDVDPNLIIQANNLAAPYDLTAGQTLNIP